MEFPTNFEELQDRYHVPENVREHCLIVAKLAKYLGQLAKEKGYDVDVDALYAAGMLHDLFRSIDFGDMGRNPPEDVKVWRSVQEKYPGVRHPEAVYQFFKDSFPEFASILRKHDYRAIVAENVEDRPTSWEDKILTYADKRVAHTSIVTLHGRFQEGFARWKKNHPGFIHNLKEKKFIDNKYDELEKDMFKKLDIDPESITDEIIKNG